jgi:flagellar hook-associated protein 3 FlgL
MRVNPDQSADLLLALAQTQQQENTALLQLSTGLRVNMPSDDPGAAAQVVLNHDQSSQVDSYEQSLTSIQGQLQTADSTLSSVVTSLQRAISLGVQGGNGTLSDADRAAIGEELQGVQSQLISLANASYQGKYIFSGTLQTQPYVVDPTTASGVSYAGNTGTNKVAIGQSYPLQVNLPGSQLFNAPSADMFQAMADLIKAVTSNSGTDTAVTELRNAFDYVTAQRTFYGNALNQSETQTNFLNEEKVQLSSQENALVGADEAKVASNLVNTENARNAALTAIGRRSATSLFDYLQ